MDYGLWIWSRIWDESTDGEQNDICNDWNISEIYLMI